MYSNFIYLFILVGLGLGGGGLILDSLVDLMTVELSSEKEFK